MKYYFFKLLLVISTHSQNYSFLCKIFSVVMCQFHWQKENIRLPPIIMMPHSQLSLLVTRKTTHMEAMDSWLEMGVRLLFFSFFFSAFWDGKVSIFIAFLLLLPYIQPWCLMQNQFLHRSRLLLLVILPTVVNGIKTHKWI